MNHVTLAPTLAPRLRLPSAVRELTLLGLGVAVVALAAQLSVPLPFTPVPLTGQTFAVLLVGGAYGASRGALTIVAYLMLGVSGVGVFADGAHGPEVLASATAGYLIGLLLAAAVVGLAADRGWDRRVMTSMLAMFAGSLMVYALGAGWLALHLHLSVPQTWKLGVEPFLVGDALKLALAGVMLPSAWRAVERFQA